MKAITVRQPWAGLIFGEYKGSMHAGQKNIENRKWKTPYRGPLLIHSASRPDEEFLASEVFGDHPATRPGMILGLVDLVAICPEDRECGSDWGWEGFYHWMLQNPRLLPNPIPYTGRQSLYSVRESNVLAAITRQLEL